MTFKSLKLYILTLFFFFTSCGKEEETETKTQKKEKKVLVSVLEVTKNNLKQEKIFATGIVKAKNEVSIKSEIGGEITNIYFDVGDYVEKGDLLAEIGEKTGDEMNINNEISQINIDTQRDLRENIININNEKIKGAEIAVRNSKISLISANNELRNTKKTMEENLKSARNNLDNARTALLRTKKSDNNTQDLQDQNKISSKLSIESSEIALENAKLSLQNEKKNTTENLKTLRKKTINVSKDSFVVTETILRNVNLIIDYEDESEGLNDSFEFRLGIKDVQSKYDTREQYRKTKNLYLKTKKEFDKIEDKDITKKINKIADIKEMTKEAEKLLDQAIKLLDNSVSVSSSSTSELFNSFKSKLESLKSQLNGQEINLDNSVRSITSTIIGNETKIDRSKKAIEIAEKNLELAKESYNKIKISDNANDDELELSIESAETNMKNVQIALENTKITKKNTLEKMEKAVKTAENAVESAQSNLDMLIKDKKSSIESIDNQIKTIVNQKKLSEINIKKLEIRAPLSGTIKEKNIEEGGTVSPTLDAFKIFTKNQKKIELGISEIDRSKVKIGNTVDIYIEGIIKKGKIETIYPHVDNLNKKFIAIVYINNDDYEEDVEKKKDDVKIENKEDDVKIEKIEIENKDKESKTKTETGILEEEIGPGKTLALKSETKDVEMEDIKIGKETENIELHVGDFIKADIFVENENNEKIILLPLKSVIFEDNNFLYKIDERKKTEIKFFPKFIFKVTFFEDNNFLCTIDYTKTKKERIKFLPKFIFPDLRDDDGSNSRAEKIKIKTGEIQGDFIEIESGIEIGDKIIIENARFLTKNSETVKIKQ